jgi:hypothetical protein
MIFLNVIVYMRIRKVYGDRRKLTSGNTQYLNCKIGADQKFVILVNHKHFM